MIKNKIAILTQAPLGTNYGNTLQAYALQEVLKKQNYEVTVLDRVRYEIYGITHWNLSQIKNGIFNLIDKKNRLTPRVFNEIFKEHFQFVHKNLNLSERLHTDEELKSHFQKNKYNIVIVGSDQTWRPKYSPNIYNYFLDFLSGNQSIKKIAYASSFGTSEWEFSDEETQKCSALVREFDAVSVREQSGVDLCRDHLKIEAEWVLDPTMLLDKEDYLAVANSRELPKRTGLFSYILDENDNITSAINEVMKILDVEHFTNQPQWRRNDKSGKSLDELKYPSVEGWLKAFDDAEFIVTNSFHGTVFSIIFNKPFLTIVNKERGAARFHSLLSEFGLAHRLVEEGDINLKEIVQDQVDFSFANERIEKLRKNSMDFLKTSIN